MPDSPADRIRAFIGGRFPDITFTDDEDIFALGFINSLFAMELVMFIEKDIGVTLPNEELKFDSFRTVTAMASLIGRQAADSRP
ncbi:acyl carrier protein [Streptomyces sp. NPDC058665]|uniref:acyl carrier protein n=1 Tax=Streptomyces sp. NPDC058665 TaxID=3346586 RepID=UPI003664FDD7